MSELIEGMARALCVAVRADYDQMHPDGMAARAAVAEARAAWAYALARLREPSEAVLDAARPIIPYPASAWALMLDAFAREIGLQMPPGAPQGPVGHDPGPGSEDTTSDEPTHAHGAERPLADEIAETTTEDEHQP